MLDQTYLMYHSAQAGWRPFRYVRGSRQGWTGRARELPEIYGKRGLMEVSTRDGCGWMKTMKFNRNCEWLA